MNEKKFIERAIELAMQGMQAGEGGPFGAVVVKNGEIVGEGNNKVLLLNDPTAHAEVVAIRDACKNLQTFQLEDCIIYTTCEPCPMCLGAIYWARPKKIVFSATRKDAAKIGFDDDFIYKEMCVPLEERKIPLENSFREEALKLFDFWRKLENKTMY